ncbi:39S ribosomal protein L15, mitochondrial [Nymphon striatum]|nr:39S ribosomal protein L15, mitochondrial [Nymphon striatum]
MSKVNTGISKALGLLRNLPRINISNLKPLKERKAQDVRGRGQHGGKDHLHLKKRHVMTVKHNNYPRVGFEFGNTPFYLKIPREFYYKGHHTRRQYPPLSLHTLQLMIDTHQVNPNEPIDMTTICNTKLYWLKPNLRHYGINLTDETNMAEFDALLKKRHKSGGNTKTVDQKYNDEYHDESPAIMRSIKSAAMHCVRCTTIISWLHIEKYNGFLNLFIAAIERNGGTVTTSYYDIESERLIPRKCLPTEDCIDFYIDPKNRGYLADPEKIAEARLQLSQKIWLCSSRCSEDEKGEMLTRRKDPRQIFFGLEPGWAVNLKDKVILKPKNQELKEYYRS